MKKVSITIKTERTFNFEFDDTKLDQKFIDAWCEHISDITKDPESVRHYMEEMLSESMYPFINLAESIAYAIHQNDADHLEGLRFQDITENALFTPQRDPEVAVYFERVGGIETEYELDLDETDIE